jgi:hypothetical protein
MIVFFSPLPAQKRLRDLKTKISSQSKKNFVLERDVRYLDSRIALLIQNASPLLSFTYSLALPRSCAFSHAHQASLNFFFFFDDFYREWPWENERRCGNTWRKRMNQKDSTWMKRGRRYSSLTVSITKEFSLVDSRALMRPRPTNSAICEPILPAPE